MKNIFRIMAVSLALTVGSCNFIDPELNVDPNNPLDVSLDLLLPQAQVTMGYVLGGDLGRYASVWSQHHAGVNRQHQAYDIYILTETDVNNAWAGIYESALQDLKVIIDKASDTEQPAPYFRGVARILTAVMIGSTVDLFNDVPFSDALKGAEQLKPAYDSGAGIYDQIQSLLRDAVVDLQQPTSTFSPDASSDLIFGGDNASWIAMARTLQARYHLHLSEIDASAYANALGDIDAGAIADNSGNALVPFGTAVTEQNPWFQFADQRTGDVVMGKFFIDLMLGINDPRLPLFASKNPLDGYSGAAAGVAADGVNASSFGAALVSDNSPVPLATYAEAKFIEAEAALPTDPGRAADAYNAAIAASLGQFGLDDAAFLAQEAADAGTITLERILTHKYIALYTSLEPYTDFRRKGFPALQPAAGTDAIATRFPYPQDERLYNGDNFQPYQSVTVFDKVFWDK